MTPDLCEKLEEAAASLEDDAKYWGNISCAEQAKAIRQAISLLRREGMVWVPEEPSSKMIAAGTDEILKNELACTMTFRCYKAMLKAYKESE